MIAAQLGVQCALDALLMQIEKELFFRYYDPRRPGSLIKSWLHHVRKHLLPDISDKDTQMVRIATPINTSEVPINPLYIDEHLRVCLKLISVAEETASLVEDAVSTFERHTGYYPDEIVLCPSRYAGVLFGCYYPISSQPIPYLFDPDAAQDFDIIVRSLPYGP